VKGVFREFFDDPFSFNCAIYFLNPVNLSFQKNIEVANSMKSKQPSTETIYKSKLGFMIDYAKEHSPSILTEDKTSFKPFENNSTTRNFLMSFFGREMARLRKKKMEI